METFKFGWCLLLINNGLILSYFTAQSTIGTSYQSTPIYYDHWILPVLSVAGTGNDIFLNIKADTMEGRACLIKTMSNGPVCGYNCICVGF